MTTVDPSVFEVASGLSIICATCTKYRKAKDLGLAKCLSKEECGSPIVGDTFHEYEGPIKDFLKFCFVCGAPSQKKVIVRGHTREIGICLNHLDYVATMAPKQPRRLPLAPITYYSDGVEKAVDSLLPDKERKSLSKMLLELEKGTFRPDS